MDYQYFTPVPRYNLPTIVPFTFRDATTLLEQLEKLRGCLIEIQNDENVLSETILKLVDDTNHAIDSALRNVVKLTADYNGMLDQMKTSLADQLAEVNRTADQLKDALAAANRANDTFSATQAAVRALSLKIDDMDKELPRKVDIDTYGYNVLDYGAKGDGIADDTAAFEKAFSAITATKDHTQVGRVFVPRGVYRITRTLTLPMGIIVEGVGDFEQWSFFRDGSHIVYDADSGAAISMGKITTLRNIQVSGSGSDKATTGVDATKSSAITLDHCTISGFGDGISLTEIWYGRIDALTLIENARLGSINYCYNLTFTDMRAECYRNSGHDGGEGFIVDQGSMVSFHGGSIEAFTSYGFKCNNGVSLNLFGVYMETQITNHDPSAIAINLRDNKRGSVVILGCQVYITNLRSFVDYATSTATALTSIGNTFKGGRPGENTHIYRFPGGDIAGRVLIENDTMLDVADDKSGQIKYISYIPNMGRVRVPYSANLPEQEHFGLPVTLDSALKLGSFSKLPSGGTLQAGTVVWWTDKNIPVFWTGAGWVKADGSSL